MTAEYLVRFDDICPTMNWRVWAQVEAILAEHSVRPILAVVPDNRDDGLCVEEPRARFWDAVRGWQSRGWTIGLHGYQHLYTTADAGLIGLRAKSEWAGVRRAQQETNLRAAMAIFEKEGVRAEIWVAPGHSFDEQTVELLSAAGLPCISDGFALFPYSDAKGVAWIPQQMWRFRPLPLGIWTVCLHHNHWGPAEIAGFRRDVAAYKTRITDVTSVMSRFRHRRRSAADIVASRLCLRAYRLKHGLT